MKIKKRITFLFIVSIVSILITSLLAPRAAAFELTTEVKATGRSWKPTQVRCRYHDGQVVVRDSVSCPVVNDAWLVQMEMLNPRIDFKEGLYYRTTLSFQWHTLSIGRELLWTPYTIDFFTLVNLTQTVNQDNTATANAQSLPFSNIFDITLRANGTEGQGVFSFGDGVNAFAVVLPAGNQAQGSVAMGTVYEYEVSGINEEQQQAGEQAQQDADTDSSSSQSDVTQGTQSLLNTLTGFVAVIQNLNPSNCKLNGNLGVGNVNLGQIDLCSLNPPSFVTIIGSLILIGVCIPLVIWTIKKIISMFRSFTNG